MRRKRDGDSWRGVEEEARDFLKPRKRGHSEMLVDLTALLRRTVAHGVRVGTGCTHVGRCEQADAIESGEVDA